MYINPNLILIKKHPNKVCKLNKAIYGLKQGGRFWNQILDKALKFLNFKQSRTDQCIYFYTHEGKVVIIAIYVDDLLVLFDEDK